MNNPCKERAAGLQELAPRVVGIIQARMGSTRLPGKTLADIGGRPLLQHVIERARAAGSINEIVVATTWLPVDRPIHDLAERCGVHCFAGSVDDVLDRFYQAAWLSHADVVVRLTADDPFKDPRIIDRVVARLLENPRIDYASNTVTPTFPEGLDVEAIRFRALEEAWTHAVRPSDREHVTPFVWRQPTRFQLAEVCHPRDLSHLRWTIDYPQDLEFARAVMERLPGNPGMREILMLLDREPDLARINDDTIRNEGYLMSVAQEVV
jgi:spore coat polysaccharide biosynthesis protein SpsF